MIAIAVRVAGRLFIFVGLPSCVVGALLLTLSGTVPAQRVGLGLWWAGALMILDAAVLRRNGLPAQLLWGLGTGTGVYLVFYTTVPHTLSQGSGRLVVAIPTVALVLATIASPVDRRSSLAGTLRETADKARMAARPERPADPAAEIARLQTIMTGGVAEIRRHHPREAAELSDLLTQYRSDHGTDTINTSSRPTSLRNAVAVLVDDMEAIRDRLPAHAPGYPPAVLVVGYARLMADLVLDRTR